VALVSAVLLLAAPVGPASADPPALTVTGSAKCTTDLTGSVIVWWTITWDTTDMATFWTSQTTPTGNNGMDNPLSSPATLNQFTVAGGSDGTATASVTLKFGTQMSTGTGSMTLPHCPTRTKPSVSIANHVTAFQAGCQPVATVMINYPASAELTTTITVQGRSSTNAMWPYGPVTMQPGDSLRVDVPPPYGSSVFVYQDGSIAIGSGDYNPQVGDCIPPMPPPPPLPTTGGQPGQPTADAATQVHSGQSGQTSGSGQPVKSGSAPVSPTGPAELDAAGPSASGAAQPAQRYASANAPSGSGAGWLWWVGLTVAVVLGAGLTAFFGYRRRKLS
jgi:hypothetical protein